MNVSKAGRKMNSWMFEYWWVFQLSYFAINQNTKRLPHRSVMFSTLESFSHLTLFVMKHFLSSKTIITFAVYWTAAQPLTPAGLCKAAGLGISTQAVSAFRQPEKGPCCKDAAAKTVWGTTRLEISLSLRARLLSHGAFFHNSCIISEEENHVLCLYFFNWATTSDIFFFFK